MSFIIEYLEAMTRPPKNDPSTNYIAWALERVTVVNVQWFSDILMGSPPHLADPPVVQIDKDSCVNAINTALLIQKEDVDIRYCEGFILHRTGEVMGYAWNSVRLSQEPGDIQYLDITAEMLSKNELHDEYALVWEVSAKEALYYYENRGSMVTPCGAYWSMKVKSK